jgi:hypothetical protein
MSKGVKVAVCYNSNPSVECVLCFSVWELYKDWCVMYSASVRVVQMSGVL